MQWVLSILIPVLTVLAIQFKFALLPDPGKAGMIVPLVTVFSWVISKLKVKISGVVKVILAMFAGSLWAVIEGGTTLPVSLIQGAANGLLACGFWSAAKATAEAVVKTKPPTA